MKKLLLFTLFLWGYVMAYGQTPTQITTAVNTTYVYVGSLVFDDNHTANSQKLVVRIIGGSWYPDSNGETTFYISNRTGLNIKQVTLGAYSADKVTLKAYTDGSKTDFYLMPNPTTFTSFAVTSFSYGRGLTPQFVNITTQATAPTATEISLANKITPIQTANGAGNIGIGTDNPTERLTVNGTVRAKEMKVDAGPWPDYVFEKDYNLLPLSDLAAYIEQHGHLPDVPKAAIVEKDGIAIGEMNTLLLKKVEELTLHLIEKDKEIQELKQMREEIAEIKRKMQ